MHVQGSEKLRVKGYTKLCFETRQDKFSEDSYVLTTSILLLRPPPPNFQTPLFPTPWKKKSYNLQKNVNFKILAGEGQVVISTVLSYLQAQTIQHEF